MYLDSDVLLYENSKSLHSALHVLGLWQSDEPSIACADRRGHTSLWNRPGISLFCEYLLNNWATMPIATNDQWLLRVFSMELQHKGICWVRGMHCNNVSLHVIDLPIDPLDNARVANLSELVDHSFRSNLSRLLEKGAHPLVANLNIRILDNWSGYEVMNLSRIPVGDLDLDAPISTVFWCKGLPYFYFLETEEFVRSMTIHLQGPMKNHLWSYAKDVAFDCVCTSISCEKSVSLEKYRARMAVVDPSQASAMDSFCKPWSTLPDQTSPPLSTAVEP